MDNYLTGLGIQDAAIQARKDAVENQKERLQQSGMSLIEGSVPVAAESGHLIGKVRDTAKDWRDFYEKLVNDRKGDFEDDPPAMRRAAQREIAEGVDNPSDSMTFQNPLFNPNAMDDIEMQDMGSSARVPEPEITPAAEAEPVAEAAEAAPEDMASSTLSDFGTSAYDRLMKMPDRPKAASRYYDDAEVRPLRYDASFEDPTATTFSKADLDGTKAFLDNPLKIGDLPPSVSDSLLSRASLSTQPVHRVPTDLNVPQPADALRGGVIKDSAEQGIKDRAQNLISQEGSKIDDTIGSKMDDMAAYGEEATKPVSDLVDAGKSAISDVGEGIASKVSTGIDTASGILDDVAEATADIPDLDIVTGALAGLGMLGGGLDEIFEHPSAPDIKPSYAVPQFQ